MLALAAAALYSLLAGFTVPTQRTLFMLAVGSACLLWRRQLSPFQAWWLALAAVLLLDPFSALTPGLWLSFGLVAALMFSSLARRQPAAGWRPPPRDSGRPASPAWHRWRRCSAVFPCCRRWPTRWRFPMSPFC
ncbi:ComEC family competence protein [Chromobacterium violaceum]|uniref:ComEC family competence protein n=1 Tax=Chromobacterium violaceum TaxID=536 RepID=A0A447T5V8_CHRVL|nr:ComEC family competence protein [Chromobacterium violaceum]